ncbi:MAG: Gfo/Idh/MocA family oxidoreductase [Candidatus Omnitrophica bacterium]|nr:Gfo/Idh/MocA family oxidoreductase [Candidatus Omnitrophota bacterium]
MAQEKKLGISVIGLFMGRNMLYVNRHDSFRCTVRTICDTIPERLKQNKDEFKIPFASTNWEDVVDRDDIDIVGIFTPDHLHFPMIKKALEAGKHVICTKPMVISIEEAKETVALVRKYKRKFLVGQTRRYVRHHQEAKDLYDSGKIGKPLFAEANYVHGDIWNVLDRGAWRYEVPQDIIYGGACHPIDHLRWYFGDIDEVFAYGATSPVDLRYPQDKEMNFLISLKFKSGLMARVLLATGIHTPPGGHHTDILPMEGFSVFGTYGNIVNYHAVYREEGRHDAPRQEVNFSRTEAVEDFDGKEYSGHLMSVLKYVMEMEECILQDKQPLINEVEGAKVISACSACWESVKTGKAIKVFNEF